MSGNYTIGNININRFTVTSSRGTIDLKNVFVNASIYESIFTPGIIADIRVFDQNDELGRNRLSGGESVNFTFSVTGSRTSEYRFVLIRLADVESTGAQKSKMYTLRCASQEVLASRTNYVAKSYNQLCSDMVRDIHQNYLRSPKSLRTESTRGAQQIVIPNRMPFDAINLIRSRSVSPDNQSSFYVYFENRVAGNMTFNFSTVERLFNSSPVKRFYQSDAINVDFRNRGDDNILAYRVSQQFSATDRVDLGGPRRLTTFNLRDGSISSQIVNTNDTSFKDAGRGTMTTSEFRNRYFNDVVGSPPSIFMFKDESGRPSSFIPEASPNFQAYIALLMQNAMRIKVVGDTVLTAGVTIDCTIPNKVSFTSGGSADPLITGKFLISRIHHEIGEFSERPRYTCTIEGIKGRYEESV